LCQVSHRVIHDTALKANRIKPTKSEFSKTAYELTPGSLTLSDLHPNVIKRGGKAGREEEYTYCFGTYRVLSLHHQTQPTDKLLQFPARTPELYEENVAPLVIKAMNGFNSTIFAYGQTGSGKSFTMVRCRLSALSPADKFPRRVHRMSLVSFLALWTACLTP
jgi:centromeric protein E